MRYLFPTLGAAIALAGFDKLVGQRGYARMFDHLDWTNNQKTAVAVAETAGGLLMLPAATRRLGGVVVSAASLAVLSSELRHGDPKLAGPRAVVLLAAVAAVIAP
jgi:hypothetical protein